MKRVGLLFVVLLLFSGCGGKMDTMNRAMNLRSLFQQSEGCTFRASVTADYGDKYYEFVMDCQADSLGKISFTVVQPESISGITGVISAEGGKLTFDDYALAFETLAQGQISPVNAPWVMIRALRGGYLRSCVEEGDLLHLCVNDSYDEDALYLDIWIDKDDRPVNAEILFGGRRILSIAVENFAFV